MDRYNPKGIEQKWQKIWEQEDAFKAPELPEEGKQKMFIAAMFRYPSGAGLHVGHVRNFTIVDALARFYAQNELSVLRPFGYDTFGLPAENYAIKTGTSPREATSTNIVNFRHQAKRLGYYVDWSREISTSDPKYYKWTQWCFRELFKKGLAYQKESYQWWCPKDQTVLANEQVVDGGHCWRCGTEVEKKKMNQWFFRITAYADELLADIPSLNWPEKIKTMQENWIGRSEGADIDFAVVGSESNRNNSGASERDRREASGGRDSGRKSAKTSDEPNYYWREERPQNVCDSIRVFTTRPDTLFGVTFLVLAPEHPMINALVTDETREKVSEYIKNSLKKSEIERQENKEKTGVFTGSYAVNPATGEEIPIWVSDYVLSGYGEGAVMGVPAHDERDFAFAEKFDLPVVKVIEKPESSSDDDQCYHGEGELVNSGSFSGKQTSDARELIVSWLEDRKIGAKKVTYKMRDWLISRQRYWGCPIPVAYDKNGVVHLIPEDQLPVLIPEVDDFKPDHTGRSALAKVPEWLNIKIRKSDLLKADSEVDNFAENLEDGQTLEDYLDSLADENGFVALTRETDTLDGYACSSWYLWRYASPHDDEHAWNPAAIKAWEPLDIYVGGDHAVAHLLYVRFWCKFFADQGYLPFREPIKELLYNGYINAPDGKKMSKSKGNVIDPLTVIDEGYGADTLRTYELFIGPYNMDANWDTSAIGGVYRFLNRCWTLCFNADKTGEHLSVSSAFDSYDDRVKEEGSRPCDDRGDTLRAAETDKARLSYRTKIIKKVTDDLHRRSFNTAVATLMEYVNYLYKNPPEADDLIALAKMLKPFAPHLASEMLEKLGSDDIWPTYDEKYLVEETVDFIVQVNGKLRAKLEISTDDLENEQKLEELALNDENVKRFLSGAPKKIIHPKNARLINIVA